MLHDARHPTAGVLPHLLQLRHLRAGAAWAPGAGLPTSVGGVTVEILPVDVVDDELVAAMTALIPQLSSSPPPTAAELSAIVDSPDSVLFVARLDDRIVGTLTLAFYRIPTGLKAWIEDVVVDGDARGHGVGEQLNRAALDESRRRRAKHVSLTSRPSREVANRLYQRLGFVEYETNVYRFTL
jgi:ribosomal protein S18 acetylase RimI-like enzyme